MNGTCGGTHIIYQGAEASLLPLLCFLLWPIRSLIVVAIFVRGLVG
jgi:hypothetical protein